MRATSSEVRIQWPFACPYPKLSGAPNMGVSDENEEYNDRESDHNRELFLTVHGR